MNKKDPDYEKSMKAKENLDLWNSIAVPDKKYLKTVSFGQRSFISIDPQYQIMKMTKIFGPVGVGWGYDVEYDYPTNGDVIIIVAKVTIQEHSGTRI